MLGSQLGQLMGGCMNRTRTTRGARRLLGALSAAAVILAGLFATAGPAQASHLSCGATITSSVTLDSNIGPCPGFALHVAASNITINLNGKRVSAANGPEETAGIHLMNVTGVVVTNGIVEGFDGGVVIDGGSGNTVRNLVVRNNRNDLSGDDPLTPADEGEGQCIYGDGIIASDSDNNKIMYNDVMGNGPYSGISLVGDSDANTVFTNMARYNNISNVRPDGSAGPCGAPFSRPHQDIGIRIEGPGADRNVVLYNTVYHNQLVGISVHGHVCNPPAPAPGQPPPPPQPGNTENSIRWNTVHHNGFAGPNERGDGIGVLRQGPADVVCVAFNNSMARNFSHHNARDGIFVGAPTTNNRISYNRVGDNGRDGIRLSGPFSAGVPAQQYPGATNNVLIENYGRRNVGWDGADLNPNCDANRWIRNVFTKVNDACVVANGGQGTVAPPPGSASAMSGTQSSPDALLPLSNRPRL